MPPPELTPEEWRARSELFDGAAASYADDRPGYPDELFDALVRITGIGPGTRLLEVGAGAGQATRPLAALGARVLALEPGGALAAVLRARTAEVDVTVLEQRLEDAELEVAAFDVAVSASAFHWVTPFIGMQRMAWALRPGGWLALWWNVFGDAARADPFGRALDDVLRVEAPHLVEEGGAAGTYALARAVRTAEIDAIGVFGPVQQVVVDWTGRHTPAELRRMFGTFSPWLALPADERSRCLDLVEELARSLASGGVVERPYQSVLYAARRDVDPARPA